MTRRTFLLLCPVDCGEEVPVTVERCWVSRYPGCAYRLVSFPSQCQCGALIHRAEPSQKDLAEAWALPEAEDA